MAVERLDAPDESLSAQVKQRLIEDMLRQVHETSSTSSSSSCSEMDDDEEYHPPTTKPSFGPLEQSNLMSRLRQFIPIFKNAPMENCEPEVVDTLEEIQITEKCEEMVDPGVEFDLSLGVYDVEGNVDEEKIRNMGIPVIDNLHGQTVNASQTTLIQDMTL